MTDKKDDSALIKEALEQAEAAMTAEKDNRTKAVDMLEFVFAEDQWDQTVKTERGERPCLNANDLPVFLDRVIAAQRSNRAGIKALPVDSNTDPLKAEIIGGLIRNIEHVSDAHVAYDSAEEQAAAGGYMGAIRVVTQYENDDLFDDDGNLKGEYKGENAHNAFNQEIRIVPVENPLNVLFDPNAKLWHRNDGQFMFLYDDMSEDLFKEMYPTAQLIEFTGDEVPGTLKEWANTQNKTIRVAEWFRKESKGTKKVYLIFNEKEEYELVEKVPEDTPKERVLKEREVDDFRIVWRKISGKEVLEGPVELPGRLWPIVPVWAKEININGKRKTRGLFEYAKDPQRMYIYTQSAITELLALQPKAPFLGTPAMFEGHEEKWRTANTKNWPYLPYNIDQQAPGLIPKRQDPPQIPTGLAEQAQQRHIEKKDIIGLHDASLGRKSNETSGLAIRERKTSDDAVTYAFHDNLNRAIKQVGRVVVGMIPKIYDTARMLRLLDIDGKTISAQAVNQETEIQGENGVEKTKIDLTIGKHDIVIMTGPGYATQRLETLDILNRIMQYGGPRVAELLASLTVELMDTPRGEKAVKRLEYLLPPEVRAMEKGQGGVTQEQIAAMIQQAVEQYKQSLEGQQEALKTEQQRLKVEQERFQTEQERLKLAQEAGNLRDTVAEMVSSGQI